MDLRVPGRVWVVVTWALSLSFAVITVWRVRHGWFTYDDFRFLGTRHEMLHIDGISSLVQPYNGHLVPVLIGWQLAATHVFGLGSYVPWALVTVAGNVGAVWVLRATIIRIGVYMPVASIAAPMLLVWGPLRGALVWMPESVFLVGVALATVQLLLSLDDERAVGRRDAWGAAASCVALVLHSAAVLGPVIVVVSLVVRRRYARAAVASAPLVVYGTWLLLLGDSGAISNTPDFMGGRNPIWFASNMWSAPLTRTLPGFLAGGVLLAAAVGGTIVAQRVGGGRRTLAWCLLVQAVLTTAVVTRSRVGAITDLSQAGRYVAVLTFVLAPLVLLAIEYVIDRVPAGLWRRGAWSGLLVVLVLPASGFATLWTGRFVVRGNEGRAAVARIAADPRLDEVPGDLEVDIWREFRVSDIRRLRDEGALWSPVSLDDLDRATNQSVMFVRSEPAATGDLPATVDIAASRGVALSGPGCVTVSANGARPGRVQLGASAGQPEALTIASLTGFVDVTANVGDATSPRHRLKIVAPGDIRLTVEQGTAVAVLVTGEAMVCGVDTA